MASIIKRGNSYRIYVSCGRDSQGGQIVKTTTYKPMATTPKKIEKEVQDFAREYETRIREGRYFDGETIKLVDFIETWRTNWAEQKLTKSIQENYLRIINRRFVPVLGNRYLTSIRRIDIQTIITGMEKAGLAPKTIKYAFTCINSVMRYAYRMEVIDRNPCERVELPKIKQVTEIKYFDLEQAKRFLNEAIVKDYPMTMKSHTRVLKKTGEVYLVPGYTETRSMSFQWRVYFNLAIYGGFRRGELIALTWNDIDFENRCIRINKAVAKTSSGQILKETKTESGNRSIVLPKACFDLLEDWMYEQKQLALRLGSYWKGKRGNYFEENNIFITNDGQRMDVDSPTAKFRKILEAYNESVQEADRLPIIRLHDLRHTSATLLLSEGVDIETVSHRLGHSKASVTLDIYGHALKSKDQTASDKLSEIFA